MSTNLAEANDEELMQFYLNQLGFNSGTVDRRLGWKTKTTLRNSTHPTLTLHLNRLRPIFVFSQLFKF